MKQAVRRGQAIGHGVGRIITAFAPGGLNLNSHTKRKTGTIYQMLDQFDPQRHHRRSIRLAGWDYRSQAYYFVTICTYERQNLFESPNFADIAASCWVQIPEQPHAHGVILDEWIIMPNHLHGLLLLPGSPSKTVVTDDHEVIMPGIPFDMRFAPSNTLNPADYADEHPHLLPGSLGAIVGTYKSGVTRRVNAIRRSPGNRVWQRGYYERIVRDNHELERIRDNTGKIRNDGLRTVTIWMHFYHEWPTSHRDNPHPRW
jgi:REP element-mobilizing transposase RayT